MSVKSTVTMTRKEAEDFYVELRSQLYGIQPLTDEYLEDEIERMNDYLHGGECFENYIIEG